MIEGIIPPVATPMQANEDLDLPRFKWFLDHLIGEGVHGVFVLGTNSEFYALEEREKQEVIATAVAHVRGRVPVYAGTGAETTREAVRLTTMAQREGASGVSVITPYFVNPSQQEIFDHYRRIAESTSLPVVPLDLAAVGELTFEAVDLDAFPCLGLARAAAQAGGTSPCVLNAANEIAVHAFLGGHLGFLGIPEVIEATLSELSSEPVRAFESLYEADRQARAVAAGAIAARN